MIKDLCFDILYEICKDTGLEFIHAIGEYDMYSMLVKNSKSRSLYMGTIYSYEAFDSLVVKTTLITGIKSWNENPFAYVDEDMYMYMRDYIINEYTGSNRKILLRQIQMENMVRDQNYNLVDVSQHCQYSCHPMLTITMLSQRMSFHEAIPFLITINDYGSPSNMVIDVTLKTFCEKILSSTSPKLARLRSVMNGHQD